MPILFSVTLFAIRTLFLLGIGISDTLVQIGNPTEEQTALTIADTQIHPLLLVDSSIELLLIENQEQEEKSENEDLPLLYFVETATFAFSNKNFTPWQASFFSSKAKQDGVDLYDLYGCWRSELA